MPGWRKPWFGPSPPRIYENRRPTPDFARLHQELQSHRHLTLQLWWEEYRQNHPDGYSYTRLCELYQRWRRHRDVVLRQEYKAGEKLFVDFAGDTIPIFDAQGGPQRPAYLFVAVPVTTPTPKPRQVKVWKIGLEPMSAPSNLCKVSPSSSFRTTRARA